MAALQRLEEAVDKLEAASGEKGAFLDELVMQEVLSELKEIAQRDGISCTCGSHRWKLQVNFSSIDLFCADCGRGHAHSGGHRQRHRRHLL